jgi:hypothetical protein
MLRMLQSRCHLKLRNLKLSLTKIKRENCPHFCIKQAVSVLSGTSDHWQRWILRANNRHHQKGISFLLRIAAKKLRSQRTLNIYSRPIWTSFSNLRKKIIVWLLVLRNGVSLRLWPRKWPAPNQSTYNQKRSTEIPWIKIYTMSGMSVWTTTVHKSLAKT